MGFYLLHFMKTRFNGVLPVVLHEHQVPELHHLGAACVDQRAGVSAPQVVVVDLRAGAAGPRVPHLPEVLLQTERENAILLHPAHTHTTLLYIIYMLRIFNIEYIINDVFSVI
jgi:hypothetical protein